MNQSGAEEHDSWVLRFDPQRGMVVPPSASRAAGREAGLPESNVVAGSGNPSGGSKICCSTIRFSISSGMATETAIGRGTLDAGPALQGECSQRTALSRAGHSWLGGLGDVVGSETRSVCRQDSFEYFSVCRRACGRAGFWRAAASGIALAQIDELCRSDFGVLPADRLGELRMLVRHERDESFIPAAACSASVDHLPGRMGGTES